MRKNLNNVVALMVKQSAYFAGALSVALLATGCKEQAEVPVTSDAPSEVLPAAVSDAMLPLDTVKSQSPLAPPTASVSASDKARTTKNKDASAEGASSDEASSPAIADTVTDVTPEAQP